MMLVVWMAGNVDCGSVGVRGVGDGAEAAPEQTNRHSTKCRAKRTHTNFCLKMLLASSMSRLLNSALLGTLTDRVLACLKKRVSVSWPSVLAGVQVGYAIEGRTSQ